jgi:sulfopyruvate decarboxylase subunit alpha
VLDALASAQRTFITSVPDKGLAALLDAIDADQRFTHVACTREEEAVGLCAGAAFAGRRGVLLMQNSGLGNAVNALTSLVSFYQLPLLMLVSMRGGPGERIAAQLPMGRATLGVLAACGFGVFEARDTAAVIAAVRGDTDGRIAVVAAPEVWAGIGS